MGRAPNPWPGGVADGLVLPVYLKIFAIFLVGGIILTIFDCDGAPASSEQPAATATTIKSAPISGLSSVTPAEQSAAVAGLASVTPGSDDLVESLDRESLEIAAPQPTVSGSPDETVATTDSSTTRVPDEVVDLNPLVLSESKTRLPVRQNHPKGTFLAGGSESELVFVTRRQNGDLVLETRDEHGDLQNSRVIPLPLNSFDKYLIVEGEVIYTDKGLYDFQGELLSNLDFLELPVDSVVNGIFASEFGDVFYLFAENRETRPEFRKHFSTLPVYSIKGGQGLHAVESKLIDDNRNYTFGYLGKTIPDYLAPEGASLNSQLLHTTTLIIRPDRSFVDESPSFTTSSDPWRVDIRFSESNISMQDWAFAEDGIWVLAWTPQNSGVPCLWYSEFDSSKFGEIGELRFRNVEDHGACSSGQSGYFVSTGANVYLDTSHLVRLFPAGSTALAPKIPKYGCEAYYAVWSLGKITCTTRHGATMHIFNTDGSYDSAESLDAGVIVAMSESGYYLGYDTLADLLFLKHIEHPERAWSVIYDEFAGSGLSDFRPNWGGQLLTVADDLSIEMRSGGRHKWTYSPKIGEVFRVDDADWRPPGSNCRLELYGLLSQEYQQDSCVADDVLLVQREIDSTYLLIERQRNGELRLIEELSENNRWVMHPASGRSGEFLILVTDENFYHHLEIWSIE